jgi:hypothetical protein
MGILSRKVNGRAVEKYFIIQININFIKKGQKTCPFDLLQKRTTLGFVPSLLRPVVKLLEQPGL